LNKIFKELAGFSFFQIYIETKTGNIVNDFKDILSTEEIKKLDKNKIIKIKNNDSIITTDNWSKLKDVFFTQRMETYNSSYTLNEKIKLELETLKKLPINKTDYKILKGRYQKYLTNLEPPQKEIDKPKGVIQNLFNFIEFLHSNIKNFTQYDNIIKELNLLDIERNKLKPETNYKDKLKHKEVQNKLEQKYDVIDENIIQLIKQKSTELNVCDWNKLETIWTYNISEIRSLKENFNNNDVDTIIKYKQKYIEFKEKHNSFIFQSFFFTKLDDTLKELFNFFKETNKNEPDILERKTKEHQPIEANKPDDIISKHPKHDPNLWSSDCYNLFKYLLDNYYTSTKRQLTNIWFFLNEYDKIKYNLKGTKDNYRDFIEKNYNISIKNFDKASVKYLSEYGTMNDHRINYEDNF
jgi:hypothetical protein